MSKKIVLRWAAWPDRSIRCGRFTIIPWGDVDHFSASTFWLKDGGVTLLYGDLETCKRTANQIVNGEFRK